MATNNRILSKISDLFRKIELVNDGIDTVINLTDNDLSSLSSDFQQYHINIKELIDLSGEISNSISGSEVKESLNELNTVLTQIQNFIGKTSDRFSDGQKELSKVNKTLGEIVDNLSGFKSLVKHLRMLGISTKIESVRLGLEDRGFYTLAEDVEKLSTMITKKSLDIREKLSFLLNLINGGMSTIKKLARTQNDFTMKIIGEAMHSSGILAGKYQQSAGTIKNIIGLSDKISKSISDMTDTGARAGDFKDRLKSLKSDFNDITSGSKKKIAASLAAEDTDGFEFINNFKHSLKQKTEQVKDFEHNLDAVISKIESDSKKIEEGLSSASNEVSQFIDHAGFGRNSLLNEISKKLITVTETIEHDSEISEEMVSSMARVADTIGDLSGFVDEIDEIGTEVELIALNASVKAAKTGEEGAALGVLAESIQKLSIDAKNQTALIMKVLKSVMETSEKLRQNFNSKNSEGNKKDLSGLSSRINELLSNLKIVDENVTSQIELLNEKIGTLAGEINKNSKQLMTDTKVRSIFDPYLNEFEDFLNGVVSEPGTDPGKGIGTNKSISPGSRENNSVWGRGNKINQPKIDAVDSSVQNDNGLKGGIEYL